MNLPLLVTHGFSMDLIIELIFLTAMGTVFFDSTESLEHLFEVASDGITAACEEQFIRKLLPSSREIFNGCSPCTWTYRKHISVFTSATLTSLPSLGYTSTILASSQLIHFCLSQPTCTISTGTFLLLLAVPLELFFNCPR